MTLERAIKEKHLEILALNRSIEYIETFFPYTSGKIGNIYVHGENIMKNGHHYREAIYDLKILIDKKIYSREYDVISGGESRDWIFSLPISFLLGKPHCSMYKDGRVIGSDLINKAVIHVSDLNNEGFSLREKWMPLVEKIGGKIKKVFFYIDRCENGFQILKNSGLESYALVNLDKEAYEYALKIGLINKEEYGSLLERLEDSEAWAIRMLKSEKGIEKMAELLNKDNKGRESALKVINEGYPDLKEEILERLKKYPDIEMIINPVNV